MDNLDDYFDDDLVLDEQTLAILDREEQKYLTQVQQRPLPAVTKRLKTRDGWSPGVGSRTREDDFDDLPEISVTLDGNYGFTDSATLPTNSSQTLQDQPNASQVKQPDQNKIPSPMPQPHISLLRPTLETSHNRVPSHHPRNPRQTSAGPSGQSGTTVQPPLQKQLADLQAQLCELKNENQKIQTALKAATDQKYAKEGEVSILRKAMEKTAKTHATEIARIKVAKEEAEARQKQIERQMKEETERLKTQFTFKQQELEASFRKPPPSVRPARIMKSIPATPVRKPSQMDNWTVNQNSLSRQKPGQSPRASHIDRSSPVVSKKPIFLPGFQNAFTTTPLRFDTTDAKAKGHGIRRDESFEYSNQMASQKVEPWIATQVAHSQTSPKNGDSFGAASSDRPTSSVDGDGDAMTVDEVDEGPLQESEPIEPLNHKAELFRIIMTHVQVHTREPTFQLLIGLPFSQQFPNIQQARDCTQACQAIMVMLSDPTNNSDYDACTRQVARSFLSILQILLNVAPSAPVTALLSLLRSLVLLLPSFTKALLKHEAGEEGPLVVNAVCDFVGRLAASPLDISKGALRESLAFLEALFYDIPDEIVARFCPTPKYVNPLVLLLDISQPHSLVESLSRVFLLLATYSTLQTQLSSQIYDDGQQALEDSHLIRHLCIYLLENLDHDRNATVHDTLIGCLAQLSLTQAETLARSHLVIPTLVYFVSHLAAALWNDDESHLRGSLASPAIRSINQGLFLLHGLIYSSEPIIPLRDKLQHSSHRNLNNLMHMFVVSFGQLSYSDPPSWIGVEGREELESLAGPARDLLDLVVDGPEGESVWAAYQMESDNVSESDEEEREARRLEDNI